MVTVSLCMIVKNEEAVLARCLDGVSHLVDEIILVDTGSRDQTKMIAEQYNCSIYDFPWIDDFAAARNYSFDQATQEYILWLDADDVLDEQAQALFSNLKESLDRQVDVVTMPYHLAFDEYGNLSFSLRRNRLVKRERNFRWRGKVHEYLEVYGQTLHSDAAIVHKSEDSRCDRNLRIYEKMLQNDEPFTPRDLYYFGNELVDHHRYEEAISVYERFLNNGLGWVEDNITCCGKLADCYYETGQSAKAILSILRTLSYASPRAEFCCRLGEHFLQKEDYLTAIYWFKLATKIKPDQSQLGFLNLAYSTWLPHLQLCFCYSKLQAYHLAYLHNEAARQFRPNDDTILHNETYLSTVIKDVESKSGKKLPVS